MPLSEAAHQAHTDANKKYTTAMLQEFFFYNRKSDKITDQKEQFTTIISKNDPKNFELLKDTDKNFYM